MCVVAFAWGIHSRWRWLLAGNRDEFHSRPSEPLRRWDRHNGILAGKDVQSGGTWLGVSEQGRFAVITNVRGLESPRIDSPSRGVLLRDWLSQHGPYANPADHDLTSFAPFNVIALQNQELNLWRNRPVSGRRSLSPGLYGLSNGALDEPWPRTSRLKDGLREWIHADSAPLEALLDSLREEAPPTTGRLPSEYGTPVAPSEKPVFILNAQYGTRCSTVVAIDQAGQGIIVERRFDILGEQLEETTLNFAWPW